MPDWPAGFVPPFDRLWVPFIFVPDGEPIPQDWLAAHPGWVKFRATFRPKTRQPSPEPSPQPAPSPKQIEPAVAPPSPGVTRLRHVPLLPPEVPIPPPDLRAGDAQRTFERGALESAKLYTNDPRYLISMGMTVYRARAPRQKSLNWLQPATQPFGIKETRLAKVQGTIIPTADDGTPSNNQAQNRQIDAVCRMLQLTKDQRTQLHLEIGGQNMGFKEILEEARAMFNK